MKRKTLIDLQYLLRLDRTLTIESIQLILNILGLVLSLSLLLLIIFSEHNYITDSGIILFAFLTFVFTKFTFSK